MAAVVTRRPTVLVFGDQLNDGVASLQRYAPGEATVLFVESDALVHGRRWHRQRLHLVLAGMTRFAAALRAAGWDVDHRRAPTVAEGLAAHRAEFAPSTVTVMAPMNAGGVATVAAWAAADETVEVVANDQFLCSRDEFAGWAGDRTRLRMEDFYRWQRRRFGWLMDGDDPVGGRWNFDAENREPPPKDGTWPAPVRDELDDVDRDVIARLPDSAFGAEPDGTWPTDRPRALARLAHFTDELLPRFGPHEDAITERSWHLAHSLLSPALNVGLLSPAEVVDAAVAAYDDGRVPLASVEGFVRQVIGWREYVHGVHHLWGPEYAASNHFAAERPLPPVLFDPDRTQMRCVGHAVEGVRDRAWTHHIQRLMVLGNLALLAGVDPQAFTAWMTASFVDAADWVMAPNVIGMALWADGGRMASKPYAAGGAYLNRMSDHCRSCAYDPRKRVGETACPFTTLYWDFLDRNRDQLAGNHRMAMPMRALDKLADLDGLRERAVDVLERLDRGEL